MYLQFGVAGDVPVPAKYDSDNKTDLAVWRPSEGTWYIQQSTNQTVVTHQLGSDVAKDILVPADYDGDNKADVAVWQQSNGSWTIKQSSDNQIVTQQLGATGDVAVPSSYIRRSSAPRGQSVEIPRDGLASVSYDTQTNRINNTGWEYDVAGNQTRALAQDGQNWLRFEYDVAGSLVKVKNDSGETLQSYVYGVTNKRLVTQDSNENSSIRTYYAWSGNRVVAEYNESSQNPDQPQWIKSYVFLSNRLLSMFNANGVNSESVQFYHPDKLGTRLITNASDTTVQEQVTLPFGTALDSESTGSSNRRFTSYERSNTTGLDYAVNRTYDAQQGRFTQVDPLCLLSSSLISPQTLNLYAYCGNDPINHTDPDGLFFKKLFKWISKILKWVVIALTVAVIVLSLIVAPGSQGLLASIFFKLTAILGKIGSIFGFTNSAVIAAAEAGSTIAAVIAAGGGLAVLAAGSVVANALSHFGNKSARKKASRRVCLWTVKLTFYDSPKNKTAISGRKPVEGETAAIDPEAFGFKYPRGSKQTKDDVKTVSESQKAIKEANIRIAILNESDKKGRFESGKLYNATTADGLIAEDVGGGVKGAHIDIYVESGAKKLGTTSANVLVSIPRELSCPQGSKDVTP
jgi:RHS repeat-associated protein